MGKGVYKFVEYNIVKYKTNLIGREFSNEWITINKRGIITITPKSTGYAWDGCSPKKEFLDLLIGTPDGRIDKETNKPITYYASLLHDCIYQFKNDINISRSEADKLFKLILKERNFYWFKIYYICVRLFGGFYGNWKCKIDKKITFCKIISK